MGEWRVTVEETAPAIDGGTPMTVTIPIRAIELTPGSTISIHNLSWQDFEEILTELGEQRSTRIAYYRGTLEIMSPLALHERPHRIIAYILTTILDAQGRDWEDFGSTTLKQPEIAGVEPDTCFYIQNASRVRGCTDMNLDIYPPPDLAIESDVTSRLLWMPIKLCAFPKCGFIGIANSRFTSSRTVTLPNHLSVLSFPICPSPKLFPNWCKKRLMKELVGCCVN
jgi:hypothetical protein